MNNLKFKSSLATVVALALLTPAAQAQANRVTFDAPTVGQAIAAQGNAALELIRAEVKAAMRPSRPHLPAPARVRNASLPVAGSAPAKAALAE